MASTVQTWHSPFKVGQVLKHALPTKALTAAFPLGDLACVLETRGALDKFVGDAVMAQADHAARACETALRMPEGVDRADATLRVGGSAEALAHFLDEQTQKWAAAHTR